MDLTLWALGARCRAPPVQHIGDWPNSLDCTDLKISVEPAVTQNCVPLLQTKKNNSLLIMKKIILL